MNGLLPWNMSIQEIANYIFLNDDDPRGDIAFVFGTWNAWKESVERAAELYNGGFVSKIIVSGGTNPLSGVVEFKTKMGEAKVMEEVVKIQTYLAKGDLVELDIG